MRRVESYVVVWRYGLTLVRVGVWIGIPKHVTDGRGFQKRWRPFGRFPTGPFAFRPPPSRTERGAG